MMKHFLSLILFSASLMLAACDDAVNPTTQTNSASAPTSDANIQAASDKQNHNLPTYLVGSEINYAPFTFKDENGQPIGFEVDLLTAIGKEMGFNVKFINSERNKAVILDTLNSDRYKIWASALTISPENQELTDYSQPYLAFQYGVYLLDNPKNANIKTIEDFKGKKISLERHASPKTLGIAEGITGSPNNLVKEDSFYLSLKAVHSGEADGALSDSRVLQYYKLKNTQESTRVIPFGEKRDIAFVVKKGNTKLLNQINQGLEKIKANGTYDHLLEKWFGKSEKDR